MAALTPWQRLQQADLVEGETPRDTQPHWSSRFLLGMVGWVAALFLLFFLFMSFSQLTQDANSALMMGAVLMAIAFGLNRFAQRSDLWDQFVLALALAADACCSMASSIRLISTRHHSGWGSPPSLSLLPPCSSTG